MDYNESKTKKMENRTQMTQIGQIYTDFFDQRPSVQSVSSAFHLTNGLFFIK